MLDEGCATMRVVVWLRWLLFLSTFCPLPLHAQSTLTIVVGTAPAAGPDIYSRLIAPYLTKHLPSHPTIIVQNMPGVSGLKAAEYLYKIARQDGSVLGSFTTSVYSDAVMRETNLYDYSQFGIVGTASITTFFCATYGVSAIRTFQQARQEPLIMGATSAEGPPYMYAHMVNRTAKTKFTIVPGYRGTPDVLLAMQRHEVDGMCWDWASAKSQKPDWIAEGKLHAFVQIGPIPNAQLDAMGVPNLAQFISADYKDAVDLITSQQYFGKPFLLPPNVPRSRLDILRKAFAETITDPELLRAAESAHVDISTVPISVLHDVTQRFFAVPTSTLQKAKDLTK